MVVQTYMEPTITATANGFLLSADGFQYVLEWVGEKLLVTGPDTCYYLMETLRGLEQVGCTLSTSTLLLLN
jgi:hypothetical protein